ncbi:hypothetical protein Amsp01_011290 [Amycolatopsis sp. NBRC 101858]|uniref:hypothetical protein n=1 Tax=Amycolatopsis sp. NBRC 101858 TaxID=3032200 RepID=UPI0024A2A19B|nr:hypothetical protein [Amycolatopsis sp. NBRC 101858]GLY35105.1 hypothetical protein Amsp01_011290 [Amycolatopsis sp. NBRC 101858]
MDVREPALPVDPWLPGEPTAGEVAAARAWLARRGVRVWLPTRLLSLRLGSREWAARTVPWYAVGFGVATAASHSFADVPGRFGLIFVVLAVFVVVRSREIRRRDEVAERWVGTGSPPALREAARQVGRWYLATTTITFGGGAALCAATIVVAPSFDAFAQTFALAVGAGSTAAVLGRILRAPVVAEDRTSLAVDGLLRAQDAHRYAPSAMFAFAATPVAVLNELSPGWLSWLALAYLVVAIGTEVIGGLVTRHRKLPPGFYGR